MQHINSYPKVYALGHSAIQGIFDGPVLVEEKIDGSQFSMAILDGELCCRSKNKNIILDAPEQMFIKAIETAKTLPLHPGLIYRCEYLSGPKHNTLRYSRIPDKHLIIYDIQTGLEEYAPYWIKVTEASRIGLECVPLMYAGPVEDMGTLNAFIERDSVLGGTTVEGIVVKNYAVMTKEGKAAMGKYVSERFKETNKKSFRAANPHTGDVIVDLTVRYKTHARWEKAIQHLRDAGTLEGAPRDIGALIREVQDDVLEECGDEIRNALFNYAWPKIRRGLVAGLPEWYKQRLAESAFEE